jgi:L-ascorbate metabolism protein UlaG (beta-lactamase superfamily)
MKLTNVYEQTRVCFINHSSVLIRRGDQYLLTDPWHQRPAFGSWLPSLPQYMHPAYLAALGARLSVLISHGHDDHCDDEFLLLLDKKTQFITANFNSPSVINRLKRLGFTNVLTVDRDGANVADSFIVKSYITTEKSLDDATYTINTGDGLVIHCNDNWYEFDSTVYDDIRRDRDRFEECNVMLLSQSNSASGFPITYTDIPLDDRARLLRRKIRAMVIQGLRNAESLSLRRMFSYAGFAVIFVKDKPEYYELGLMPTARFLKSNLLNDSEAQAQLTRVDIAEFEPGDVIDLGTGELTKAFIDSNHYSDDSITSATARYYELSGVTSSCDTYSTAEPTPFDAQQLDYFMSNLGSFVLHKLDTDPDAAAFRTMLGKSFEIQVTDLGVQRRLVFGENTVKTPDADSPPNKRLRVTSFLMARVLSGELLFEKLYTGYQGEWQRYPPDVYNRDIVVFLVMYSYVYKNRLAAAFGREGVVS